MPARTFTPAEANSALGDVRPLAERLVAIREELRELGVTQGRHVLAIGGNGAGRAAGDLGQARAEVSSLLAEAAACAEELERLGVVLKDADLGLVDFPALREDEDVLLCWHVGEESVSHWHGLDEGFGGRKPVDWGQ